MVFTKYSLYLINVVILVFVNLFLTFSKKETSTVVQIETFIISWRHSLTWPVVRENLHLCGIHQFWCFKKFILHWNCSTHCHWCFCRCFCSQNIALLVNCDQNSINHRYRMFRLTANLVLKMTTKGDKSESDIAWNKFESGNVLTASFWSWRYGSD